MDCKTILIVDDETHILNVLSLKFTNAGFNVITAEDGQEACEVARSERPDLIVTDYQMPKLSGLELCTMLQSDPDTRHIPAIILTARGFSISQADVNSANIKAVISKPFSPRELLARVTELLEETTIPAEART